MMTQKELDRLVGAVLESWGGDLMTLPSAIETARGQERDVLDRFVVVSDRSLRCMIETLLRDAVGITHNLDSFRAVVQKYGFREDPDPLTPIEREFVENTKRQEASR